MQTAGVDFSMNKPLQPLQSRDRNCEEALDWHPLVAQDLPPAPAALEKDLRTVIWT